MFHQSVLVEEVERAEYKAFLSSFFGYVCILLSHHYFVLERHCPHVARPGLPDHRRSQGPFRTVVLLPVVHGRRRTSCSWQATVRRMHNADVWGVTPVLFSDVCSDRTYAGHRLLWPH